MSRQGIDFSAIHSSSEHGSDDYPLSRERKRQPIAGHVGPNQELTVEAINFAKCIAHEGIKVVY